MTAKGRTFFIEWLIVNMIGFLIANFLGSSIYGVVPGRWYGHFLLGAAFGTAQAIVFMRHYPRPDRRIFLVWPIASGLGFMFGAVIAHRVAYMIPTNSVIGAAAAFGLVLGIPLSLIQWAALRWVLYPVNAAHWWLPFSILAWVVAEAVSILFNNDLWFMPFFGLMIALFMGVAWVWRIGPGLESRA
jgi:hypothetical protein